MPKSVRHLKVQALARAAPQQVAAGFREPLCKALSGVPAREDRPMTLMAIEAVTALISSGCFFTEAGAHHLTQIIQSQRLT